jgi:hypothetical protein
MPAKPRETWHKGSGWFWSTVAARRTTGDDEAGHGQREPEKKK